MPRSQASPSTLAGAGNDTNTLSTPGRAFGAKHLTARHFNASSATISGAIFDPRRVYRYHLWRIWDEQAPRLCFVMLNPSTADARKDDRTIRRCIGFARRWGYGGVDVVNLFAYRVAQPSELRQVTDPVGPENDAAIANATAQANRVVIAWGIHGEWQDRAQAVLPLLSDPHCLGRTRDGHPRHPLYVRGDCVPVPFEESAAVCS